MKTTEINKIIDIKLIDENPQNPRTEIGDVSDLEASIKAHGLIQPITVRPVGKRYQVVAGSRRFAALKKLGFTKIACTMREMDDKEAFEIATTENITRKDMDPADECMAVARMLDDGNDIHTVASHFGRHPRWVIGRVKMARLGSEALEKLKDGTITLGHAEALTMADDKDIERFLGMAEYRSPEELKNIILNERKNLANAKFDTYKICKNCPKQSVKQQDIFGDISESYCLDGECFARNVAKQVEQIKKQFQANGFKECPESEKTSFDYSYRWVDVESEETLDEDRKFKVKWLRANGFKAYYKINENDATYKFKWNLDEYKLVGKNKTSFIVGSGKLRIDHKGMHYKGTRNGEPYEFTADYKNLYTLITATDASCFNFYYKGQYFDVFPKHQTVGKITLLVEEMHRYHVNFYKNFKWNDYMYEGMELGIDEK